MAYDIKAYETEYKGHIFRSRLEARWAAMFDLLGWQWTYEPFDLGVWSPDFLLHGMSDKSRGVLVEVKGPESEVEQCKSKIEAASLSHFEKHGFAFDVLIVKERLTLNPKEDAKIGEIGEVGDYEHFGIEWDDAMFGKSENGTYDFCHASFSYSHRLNGIHNGAWPSLWSRDDYEYVQSLWGKAHQLTRWTPNKK